MNFFFQKTVRYETEQTDEIPSIQKRQVPRDLESLRRSLAARPIGSHFFLFSFPFSKESHFAGESRTRSRICGFDSDLVDEERSKSVGIREPFSVDKGRREREWRVFVFLGAERTYNKLKSHHPRDLVAITRLSSLGDGREIGKCPVVVSRHHGRLRRQRRRWK